MQLSGLDAIKEIPGFKVILRTILKSQIQHLVSKIFLFVFLVDGWKLGKRIQIPLV